MTASIGIHSIFTRRKTSVIDTDPRSNTIIRNSITRTEWRWAWALALTVIAISCLPYLAAWIGTPPGYQFGGFLVTPGDANTYLAKMRLGWFGSWQLHLMHTPELHGGVYLYLYYIFLGHVARVIGLPLILVYHAARVLNGLFMLLIAYSLIARLTRDPFERRLAFWLVGTSAGCGWLGVLLGTFPIDLWVPEAFAFFSLLTNPHFPLALALMLIIIRHVIWPLRGIRSWLITATAGLGLAVVQPFVLAPVYATLVSYLLVRRWQTGRWHTSGLMAATCAVAFSTPIILYDYQASVTNPVLAAWTAQNVTPAPSLLNLTLGYGIVGLLAIVGGMWIIRRRDQDGLGLLCWSVVTLVLTYLPSNLQRRFLTGLGIPLAILATIGFTRWLLVRIHGAIKKRIIVWVIAISAAGTIFLLLLVTLSALGKQGKSGNFEWLYLSRNEAAAMHWLLIHAPDEVVLASLRTGNLLPGHAGVRVYLGHPMETTDAETKSALAVRFFQGAMQNNEWQALRGQYRIRYLFLGPTELAIGGAAFREWQQNHASELTLVFQQGEVSIYQLL